MCLLRGYEIKNLQYCNNHNKRMQDIVNEYIDEKLYRDLRKAGRYIYSKGLDFEKKRPIPCTKW